jgi:hypothetical protein
MAQGVNIFVSWSKAGGNAKSKAAARINWKMLRWEGLGNVDKVAVAC